MKETTLENIAKLLERGSIYIARRDPRASKGERSPSYSLSVVIVTSQAGQLVQMFGGSKGTRLDYSTGIGKPFIVWAAQALKAKTFLEAVLPYLTGSKLEQAKLAIEFQNSLRPRRPYQKPLTKVEIAQREEFKVKMRQVCPHKGISPYTNLILEAANQKPLS